MKLLDDYSGPDLDLWRVSLCEGVAGKRAHCFVEWCCLCRRVGLWILIWIFLYQSKDESYNKFWLKNLITSKLDYYLDQYSGPDQFRRETFTQSRWQHTTVGCFVWGFSFWTFIYFIKEKLPGSFQDWHISVWRRTLQFGRVSSNLLKWLFKELF